MLSNLLEIFGVHRLGMVLGVASQVVRTFEQEFAQDHNAKIAAIDSLIDVLKQHKEKLESTVPAVVPPIPSAQ